MLKLIKNYWPTALAGLILLTALTGAYAKYVTERSLTGTLTVQANIGTVKVQEHKINLQPDGAYTLLDTIAEGDQIYDTVLPGLNVPKDPHVVISGVTADIPVYVFIKVETDTLPDTMTYELRDDWKPVDDYTDVYVYSDTNGPVQVTGDRTVYILTNNEIVVSQKLLHSNVGDWELSFSACMKQYVSGQSAKQIYENS